jgi:hypothetical protein
MLAPFEAQKREQTTCKSVGRRSMEELPQSTTS